MQKFIRNTSALFVVIGIGLIASSLYSIRTTLNLTTNGIKTLGTVTRLTQSRDSHGGTLYQAHISYKTSSGLDIEFGDSSRSSSPAYSIGQHVPVLYNPETPRRARIDTFANRWLLALVFGGMGSVFLFFGAYPFYVERKRRHTSVYLESHGTTVTVTSPRVEKGTWSVNNRQSFIIRADWLNPAANKMYTITSDAIWYDPEPYLKRKTLQARVDPLNPKRHELDLSFLPQNGS